MSLKIRALDNNYDWTFGKGKQNYISENKAISQLIRTNLLLFLGECFYAVDEGIDWITYLSNKNILNNILSNIRKTILSIEEVTEITNFQHSIENEKLYISCVLNTIYTNNYNYSINLL